MARKRKGEMSGNDIIAQIQQEGAGNASVQAQIQAELKKQKELEAKLSAKPEKAPKEPKEPKAPTLPKEPKVAEKKQEVAATPPLSDKDELKGMLKNAAMEFGNRAFKTAFPDLAKILEEREKKQKEEQDKENQENKRDRQETKRGNNLVAERISQTNSLIETVLAKQEYTISLLNDLMKEFKKGGGAGGKEKESGILQSAIDMLEGAESKAKRGAAKTRGAIRGIGGGSVARGAARVAGGALLGGGLEAYQEYQESGSGSRAAAVGGGAVAGGAAGAIVGQMLIPIPVVGAMIGGAIGSWLGGKAGRATHDLVKGESPSASKDIKAAQEAAVKSAGSPSASPSGGPVVSPNQGASSSTMGSGGGSMPNTTPPPAAPASPDATTPPAQGGQNQGATGDQIAQILATIRKRESGGNYTIKAKGSSASGAYQFIDTTWQSLSKKYGGGEFKSAAEAPPDIQDKVARAYVEEILKQNGNDVSKVPVVWYTGNAQGKMSEKALAVNGGMTAAAYQTKWMNDFNKAGGGAQVASAQPNTPGGAPGAPGGATGTQSAGAQASDAGGLGAQGAPQSGATNKAQAAGAAASGAEPQQSPGGKLLANAQPMGDLKSGQNGMLDRAGLSSIGAGHVLTAPAASAYNAMKQGAASEGISWGITDSYRTYEAQVKVAQEKGLYSQGGLAATPGKSNHGWGLATDLNIKDPKAQAWLQTNAGKYGFSTIPREPWHWEYKGGGDASVIASADKAKAGADAASGAGPAGAASREGAAGGGAMAMRGGGPTGGQMDMPMRGGGGGGMAMGGNPLASAGGMIGNMLGGRGGGILGSIAGNLLGGLMEPSQPSRGQQLAQASTNDVISQRMPPDDLSVPSSSGSPTGAGPSTGSGKGNPNVGRVEPVDARSRFKDLFHLAG